MLNTELEHLVNQLLNSADYKDYAPNGLQVEGRREIKKVLPVSPPVRRCSMRPCVWRPMLCWCITVISGKAKRQLSGA